MEWFDGCLPDLQDLKSLEDRIVNPSSKTATLSATTLGSFESLVALFDVAANPIVITNIKYNLNPKTKELDILGSATVFGAVDANVYLAAFVADASVAYSSCNGVSPFPSHWCWCQELGASLRVIISAGWQMPTLWLGESWLRSLNTLEARGVVSLSTTDRSLDDGSTLEKGVVIHLQREH